MLVRSIAAARVRRRGARTSRPALSAPALIVILAAVLVSTLACAAQALAARTTPSPSPGAGVKSIVEFSRNVTIAAGETANSVVVVGGDADIAGTVENAVVVVDGDLTVRSGAVVGSKMTADDGSIVVVAGSVTKEPGATVTGKTTDLKFHVPHVSVGGLVWSVALKPVLSAISWAFMTLFLVVMTLVIAALFPHQVRAVGDRLRTNPLPSLGWGALGTFVVIPVVVIVLVLSIVGIIVAIPFVFLLPFVYLFAFAALATLIGRLLFARAGWNADNLLLMAVVGAVLVSLVHLIPVAGPIAIAVILVASFGAACSVFVEWRRRQRKAQPATATGADAPSGQETAGNG